MPLTLKMIKGLNLLPLGGPVPSGAYIARPLLSAWFSNEQNAPNFEGRKEWQENKLPIFWINFIGPYPG